MNNRPSWDEYFIQLCDLVSSRGTCDRKKVGTVIVRDRRIVSTGYNGSIPGTSHCSDPLLFWECENCGVKKEANISADKEAIQEEPWGASYKSLVIGIHIPNVNRLPMSCGNLCCYGHMLVLRRGGHDMENGHCIKTIHAECNAIAQAARVGISIEGASLYCNTRPCWDCFKTIVTTGIKEIVYADEYGEDDRIKEALDNLPGFNFRKFDRNET